MPRSLSSTCRHYAPDIAQLQNGDGLLLIAEEITQAHNVIELLGSESRQKIAPNRFRLYRERRSQLFPAEFAKHDENGIQVGAASLNESALLHSCQLVREATFVPIHDPRQCLLTHLTFPNRGETRQDSKF